MVYILYSLYFINYFFLSFCDLAGPQKEDPKTPLPSPAIWWSEREKDFPALKKMASYWLSVPSSSTAAERAASFLHGICTSENSTMKVEQSTDSFSYNGIRSLHRNFSIRIVRKVNQSGNRRAPTE